MSPTALCAILLVAAIDYGYEPMEDGGIRYLIRIEPHMVDLLSRGQVFGSDIPPEVAGRVRAFRVYAAEEPASKQVPPAPTVNRPLPIEKPPSTEQPVTVKQPVTVEQPAAVKQSLPVESPAKPPAATPGQSLRDMFLAPQALSPSEEAPRQLPKTERVEHAVALAPEQGSWPQLDLHGEESATAARGDSAPKPYFPLILAVLVAAGSSTGMLYFGWLAFDYRARYRSLLREMLGDEEPLPQLAGRLEEDSPADA